MKTYLEACETICMQQVNVCTFQNAFLSSSKSNSTNRKTKSSLTKPLPMFFLSDDFDPQHLLQTEEQPV